MSPSTAYARRFRARLQHGLAWLTGDLERYRLLPQAMAFARLTPEAVRQEQTRRLQAMLVHAGATVPYWREVFADAGFEPRDVQGPDDLQALPVLTKEIIRREGDRMISERYRKERLLVRKTGGSTAEPLVFYASEQDYEAQMALHLRALALVGVWPGDGQVTLWGYGRPWQWGNLLAPLTGRLYLDAFHATPASMDRWLRAMQWLRPTSIYGYAVAIHQLARHAAERRVRVPGLRFAFTTAEKLFAEQRRDIERGLGVRVIDLYGSHEVPRLASECLQGNMHAAPDAAVLEFVERGEDRPPRMLLTSLQAWAMPFIRYDQGDTVVPLEGTCPCGLPFPLVSMEVGKTHYAFALPGGGHIHSGFFFKPTYRIEALQTFQIRHVTLDRVEIVGVPKRGQAEAAARALGGVCGELAGRFGGTLAVDYRLVDALPKTARGKQPVVVSDVDADRV